MNVQQLLAQPPKLHGPDNALFDRYRLEDELFHFLDQNIRAGMKTLEIGAGSSTIIFALKKARHTCIVPDQKQIDRIKQYCSDNSISLDEIEFIADISQSALPKIAEKDFDCILIDGNHGFPSVFVDWYYSAGLTKLGGIIIIDDLHIWTCSTLVDILRSEPEWQLVKETSRAAIFQKVSHGSEQKEWIYQKYVTARSRRRALLPKLYYMVQLTRRGDFKLLFHNVLLRLKRS
jgi:precorrin-6B methylase 2